MRRREFLKLTGAAAAGGLVGGWARPGGALASSILTTGDEIAHILPTVSHERMLVKVSFFEPQSAAPDLRVGLAMVPGQQTDSDGRFWQFDVTGLTPATTYELELEKGGCPIFEPWELETFPAPGDSPASFRLLVYTCAGGHDIFKSIYVPLHLRQRLLRRGLAYSPDAVLAVGDHVYWDLRAQPAASILGDSIIGRAFGGVFDRTAPVLGTDNEAILKRVVDYQIAGLYGTEFRSVPMFFVRDDHDYFEDDRADPTLVTFPADSFMFDLARSTQSLYFPEYLPDPDRPSTLPDSAAPDRPAGVSETFGTLRYGQLFEGLIYDCKGYLSQGGPVGLFVPADVESWLLARMASGGSGHVVNVPSNPMGWSAGKYAEWYPDVAVGGQLTTSQPKFGWQEGWLDQHDRILQAAFNRGGVPLVLSGDIHSTAEARIERSGALDFTSNPIVSLISGTPGTNLGWPTLARGVRARAPEAIQSDVVIPAQEVNGFHIVDFTPTTVTIQHFRWDIGIDPPELIDSLVPFHVSTYNV